MKKYILIIIVIIGLIYIQAYIFTELPPEVEIKEVTFSTETTVTVITSTTHIWAITTATVTEGTLTVTGGG